MKRQMLHPSVKQHVQAKQAEQHDKKAHTRTLEVGQLILVRNDDINEDGFIDFYEFKLSQERRKGETV